ncbi:UvrD-helicase domain-containing protein [Faecalibacterium prausnitzii]|uniref:UvrD-helicase domain-containing protein n=1 Tax=Faecalibacterium prausnitzii TaxID=853 RepID=UPI003C2C16CB
MSETKWTAAQQAAIDDRGGALLVSAAAGSGKTAVLTERAVRLITDPDHPVDADKLLIVTFTNAAAAELRARIGQALLRLSQQQPHNTSLRRQRMLLQRAPICTIDAFCLDLLHKHFQALDIPPDFAPADPGSVEVLRASALAETLENAYRDPDFCAFADLYGKGRTDQAAGNTILHVYDFLRALPDYDRRLDEFLEPWQAGHGFDATCWHDLLLAEAVRAARAGRELFCAAWNDCKEDLILARIEAENKGKTDAARAKAVAGVNDKFAEPLERLEAAAALLGEVERLAAAGQWTPLYDKLTPYVLGMEEMPGFKGMKKRLTGEHKAAVKTRADEAAALFGQILELISCSEDEAEADRAAALPRLRAMFAAVRDFDARFAAKKQERKLLEFSDFEHQALRLLRSPDGTPTPLCQSIRHSYAAVMVDEYQDTNALQDAIYRCLASPAGDDLFLVGDLKQSIYRFRQADPSIFREKLDAWPLLPGGATRHRPAEGTPGQNALLALDANFRSAPEVVRGINFLFEQLMTPQLGDTAYGDGQRLVCGAPGEYAGSVEAHFLPDDTAETDAAWIARKIEVLMASGEQVRDGSSTRPVQYEDCCILLAARGDFLAYEEALTARGIPVYADARENLMEAAHIRPLISLLKVIDNPAQDIYLAAAMLGPMFGFTDDDLVRLRARAEELQKQQDEARRAAQEAAGETPAPQHRQRMSLYGALLLTVNSAEESPFEQKVRAFYARLTELRRMARSVPVEQLLEEIFVSTGYLAALGVLENGAHRREDARRFASFCAGAGANGISGLIRAIDAAAQAGSTGQDTVPGGARPGCVTIMTIHRSKGLQFPVVFVADTARRFNAADTRQPVLLHRVYGAGLRLRPEDGEGSYKTAAYAALANVHAAELRSEQMRLLYVALTRAQDKLIMTIPLGMTKTTNPLAKAAAFLAAGAGETLNRQANSFADWLRTALLVHPNGGPLRRLAENLELPFADTRSTIDFSFEEAPEEIQPAAEEAPAPEAPAADPVLTEQLRQGFAWQYPAASLAEVPAKVSVTSIVHKAEQTTLERPAFLSKDGLTAAEMGTALHAFLEHADFASLAAAKTSGTLDEAICAERDRQVAVQLTPPEIAEKLDVRRIRRFAESEAFARICAADAVLRELAFITALPASAVLTAQGSAAPEGEAAKASVLVQGIADIVLIFPDHLELLDYKTDRRKTEADFLRAYRPQLNLYALAIDKRFAPKKVTYKGIYSLELGRLIEVKG